MPQAEFRMFFDNEPASQEDLDRVESIQVDQSVTRAWEARIEIPVCLDEEGNWSGEDDRFMRAYSRIRVEIKVGDGEFAPLIDGPVVGYDTNRSSEPGQSQITLLVHDDSVILNREAAVEPHSGTDAEIATAIFGEYGEIGSTEIEPTPAGSGEPAEVPRRGTHMEFLRQLAQRNDMVAAVLPGAESGSSIGVFHSQPLPGDDLPDLTLLGADRNIQTFEGRFNAQRPSTVAASTISLGDKSVIRHQSRYRDVSLVGDAPPFSSDDEVGTELLAPGSGESADLQHQVDAATRRRSRAYEASGTVRGGCYPAVMTPLRRVTVRQGSSPTSAAYLVQSVVHKLGRSDYVQEFGLVSDSQSETSTSDLIPGGIF